VPLCGEKVISGEGSFLDHRSAWWMQLVGRPKPGVSASQVTARLKTLAPQVFAATLPPNWKADGKAKYLKRSFEIRPAANGMSNLRRQYQQSLIILMAIVGVVLLIACANVANLLLARSAARQREIAIRMAMGSGRARLVRQLLTESLLLSLSGAALGILFAQWGTRLLVSFLSTSGEAVFLDLTIDTRVLAFTAGIAILTGLLFGIAPAWRGTRVDPQSAMKANARGVIEGSKFGLGKALVVLQVALSLVLVVGAGLMLTTFFRLEKVDAGFERGRILLTSVDLRNGHFLQERRGAVYEDMLQRLRALPGVRSASTSNITPISGGGWNEDLIIDGYTSKGGDDLLVYFNRVSDRFFETMGMKIVAGRDFNAHDTVGAPKVALVNQTMANRYFAGQNPIGKRYRESSSAKIGEPVEIIGVVTDAKYLSLRESIPPTSYVAARQDVQVQNSINFEVRVVSGAPAV
jgi:putative ABC transport system permease protein